MWTLRYFKKKIYLPKHKKNCPRKLLLIPLDQEFLVHRVFGSVELRQFYSLKWSHFWSCQTLQDEKISQIFLWCRYNSIPLWSMLNNTGIVNNDLPTTAMDTPTTDLDPGTLTTYLSPYSIYNSRNSNYGPLSSN